MTDPRGPVLAAFARARVEQELGGALAAKPDAAWCRERGATFVTLRRRGRLQGCIGTLEPIRAIVDDIAHNAVGAALRDPRGQPIQRADLAAHDLEISILSAIEPVATAGELRAGVDGVVLYVGDRRVTFLPIMWETFCEVDALLGALLVKARLPATTPRDDLRLARYTVAHYRDPASC